MTTPITPAIRRALDLATSSLRGASRYAPAETIVFALEAAGLLMSPETAAELDRLRRERATLNEVLAGADEERALLRARLEELQPYTALYPQGCAAAQHRGWFADTPEPVPCPWCEIAKLQAAREEVYRAERDGALLGTYGSMDVAGGRCERELRAEYPGAETEWIPNRDEPNVLDLITHHYGHTSSTPFRVVLEPVRSEDTPAVTP